MLTPCQAGARSVLSRSGLLMSGLGMRLGIALVMAVGTASCSQLSQGDSVKSEAIEPAGRAERPPNIIILYIDDLGFGDVSAYGENTVSTPNVDFLAENGQRFTDGHATAATCTPSRYSLLTGEYAFRRQAAILPGDAPALITPDVPTLPKRLQDDGYATAVVGKWHLGLGDGDLDWNGPIRPGPLEVGFDYSFIIPATGDRVPTVYVENGLIVDGDETDPVEVSYRRKIGDRPTGLDHPEQLRYGADRQHSGTIVNGVSRIGFMSGGERALWTDEEFADLLTEKARSFIRENRDTPFFLYFAYPQIHVPRIPNERFLGQSGTRLRGDVILEMDWMTGQILEELRAQGLEDETLIIFSSDNGPVLDDGYEDGAVRDLNGHRPAGPWRGGKYSAFEAGTRMPTITYWPDTIPAGVNDALVSQVDFYASIASLVGISLSEGEAQDSQNLMPVFLGQSSEGRDVLLGEALDARVLRMGNYKYIAPAAPDASEPVFVRNNKGIESGWSRQPQLYDLTSDPGEQTNIASDNPQIVAEMQARLEAIIGSSE